MQITSAVRGVALFEAAKGLLVILAGAGALSLIHHDVQLYAERLVGHFHLNPAHEVPRIFLEYAEKLTDVRLAKLAAFAALYAAVRFTEAYGLWLKRRWAEWLAAVSGSIYIPFELLKLRSGVEPLPLGALVLNIAIVLLMISVLFRAPQSPR